MVFFARTIDRFGKDFELEHETPCFLMKQRHELKEKYSVHRSMDTLGAVLGPSISNTLPLLLS
jgi:hypothetical protein